MTTWEYTYETSFSLHQFNWLGEQGWELCGSFKDPESRGRVFIFKRPAVPVPA